MQREQADGADLRMADLESKFAYKCGNTSGGVARIVAQTEFLVIVPRQLGNALAQQERVKVLEPPLALPTYKVKQHWHERFNADAGNVRLRRTMADLFA